MSSTCTIASGRAELFAEALGRGDPVIFLHAGVADSRMWRAQMQSVSASHRAISFDRRGFGATRAPPEDYSAVADLVAVADALGDGAPAILVGCSQGGRIAIDAALRHPSRVRGLVLLAPGVSGAPDATYSAEVSQRLMQLEDAEAAGDLAQVNAIEAHLWLDGPLEPEGRVKGAVRELFLDMNGIALRSPDVGSNLDAEAAFARLGEIAQPAVVVCGDLDFRHIQERCRHLRRTMSGAAHHTVSGAAHLANLEQPARITALIQAFLERCPGRHPK